MTSVIQHGSLIKYTAYLQNGTSQDKMGNIKSHGKKERHFEFTTTAWNELKANIHNIDLAQYVSNLSKKIHDSIETGHLQPNEAAQEILSFIYDNEISGEHNETWRECHRLLLLNAVDACVEYSIQDRNLFRSILRELYRINERIDQELIYLDKNESNNLEAVNRGVTKRQEYILDQVAGWKFSWLPVLNNEDTESFYLDCPLACEEGPGLTQVLPYALYRRQNPEYTLSLLRHGINASCIYLWPLTMTIDLRLSLDNTANDVATWDEVVTIQYFCRARGNFVLHMLMADADDNIRNILPIDISYDDLLLLPPSVKKYIPEDRYRHPASLQHHCRLAVRKQILRADHMPLGIRKLPLPARLLDYVDLLED